MTDTTVNTTHPATPPSLIRRDLFHRARQATLWIPACPFDVFRGAMIRLRREDLHISQTELAGTIGTTQQTISRIERGEQGVDDLTRVKISRALGVPTRVLFLYEDEAEAIQATFA